LGETNLHLKPKFAQQQQTGQTQNAIPYQQQTLYSLDTGKLIDRVGECKGRYFTCFRPDGGLLPIQGRGGVQAQDSIYLSHWTISAMENSL